MIQWVFDFRFNSLLGVLLYWIPLSLCVVGYTLRTWNNYQRDVKARDTDKFYLPTDTIGTLIGRAIVTILPFGNIWAATFDVAPRLFESLFKWISRLFDVPLVPPRDVRAAKEIK